MSHLISLIAAAALVLSATVARPVRAGLQQEANAPHWIWHPGAGSNRSFPAETRYFRKVFRVKEASRLAIEITADNAFVLYLDGKLVAEGNDWGTVQKVEAKLEVGPHVLAARASNEAQGPAGILVRGGVLPLGQGVPIQTDDTWRSTARVSDGDGWKVIHFDDRGWARALDLGILGVEPWGPLANSAQNPSNRFRVAAGFTIETVAGPVVTGSVVAFTFDPEGSPCVSIEGGPIARLCDEDRDGRFDRRLPITPEMTNCQGLSFIRGHLYAVGNGPKGAGLYRLDDADGDGVFEKTELIRESDGGIGEHGPHAVALGPDGRLYYANGNHAHLKPPIDPASPVNAAYEGELLPHYNDSSGHAAGIMAPGGEIYRSDDDGKTWKRVVAGFRNQYDFAFNRAGELFTFDSDMEYDVGLPWYRPVRVNHCTVGAEFGWRNGSGKWPAYYFDSLPSTLDVGRGSPTGVTFYQAHQFPANYDDRMLICDWSQGRILAVKLQRLGASYKASADELVSGQPLNCTDIEVGPDGAVYFTTGGRGTEGGLYRVSWKQARIEAERRQPPWEEAIRIASPLASFSRRKIAELRRQNPEEWDRALRLASLDPDQSRSPQERIRAIELMAQFGPEPGESVLCHLASDRSLAVADRALQLLGLRSSAGARRALVKALADPDPFIRRHACEGLMQQPSSEIPVEKLIPLLSDADRWIRFAARVAIEHAEPAKHRDRLLAIRDPRGRIEGLLVLVRATRLDQAAQDELLEIELGLLSERLGPDVERDLLRLIGLTFLLGPQRASAQPSRTLRSLLLERFRASTDSPSNREIGRLLAFLDEPRAVAAILAHQASVANHAAQIHDAYCLRAIKRGWDIETKRRLWAWHEAASRWEGGFSFLGYLDYMIQDLVVLLSALERLALLHLGQRYPFPTRVLVRELDIDRDPTLIQPLVALYRRVLDTPGAGAGGEDLRSLIVEKLGRTTHQEAHAALRELYALEPARHDQLARALADHPSDPDLPILIAALASRDPNTANLVTGALLKLNAHPQGPDALANLIRLARRLGPTSRPVLDELATRWTGSPRPPASSSFAAALSAWEEVYRRRFPTAPAPSGGDSQGAQTYELGQLIDNVLRGNVVKTTSAKRGEQVIAKARCLDCHKFGDRGTGLGPDLTTVSSRFRPAEILESIVLPSRVVSDQYKSATVATQSGKLYSGMPIVADGTNLVLLLSDGTKITIPKAEIEEQKTSTTSVMPDGLLNPLSYQEIADLLALFDSMPRVAAPEASAVKGK
jgi:putative heme-binding domain-containing protein